MRRHLGIFAAFVASCGAACGSSGDATDAGADVIYGKKPIDASNVVDVAPIDVVKKPFDRMSSHGGVVLSGHIRAIYIGTQGVDASQSFDDYLTWLVTSPDYWGKYLVQYGVGYLAFDGATAIDTSAFFTPGMVNQQGLVDWFALEQRVAKVIHGVAGDAGAPSDASDEASTSDASAVSLPPIPPADSYIFFLPAGVNVDLGGGLETCVEAGGYHSYDGIEPYAIIPPCGRHPIVISHEMAEMATDPLPGQGWYSDADESNAGGEIGDLCNAISYVNGTQVTQLWSNKDGDCEPAQQ